MHLPGRTLGPGRGSHGLLIDDDELLGPQREHAIAHRCAADVNLDEAQGRHDGRIVDAHGRKFDDGPDEAGGLKVGRRLVEARWSVVLDDQPVSDDRDAVGN